MTSDAEQKARVAAAFSGAAPTYDSVIPFFAFWGVVLARRARIMPGERVIDVGCGTGVSLIPASTVAGSAVGVDLSVEMLEYVPWPVPLAAADAEQLPVRDRAFDVALSGFVLFFLPRPRTGAAELLRVLRPGGRVVVAAPEAEIPACGAVKRAWGERLQMPPPEPRSPTWAEEVLGDAGFTGIEASAEAHTFTFATGEDYVAWNWTHGGRAMLEAVPEGDRGAFEKELAAAAESARVGEGIPIHTTARFWNAVRDR